MGTYFRMAEYVHEQVHEFTVVTVQLAEQTFEVIYVLLTSHADFSHLVKIVQNFQQILNLELEELAISCVHEFIIIQVNV